MEMRTDSSSLSPREMRLVERKNKAIDELSVQFSRNAMSVEEYERLVDYIQKAESERELTIIEKIVYESGVYSGLESGARQPKREESCDEGTPRRGGRGALFSGIFGGEWSDVTFLSHREVSGASLIGGRRSFLSFLGDTLVTIEEGQLPPGKTVVNAVSLLGNIVITAPPSVKVAMEATAILGSAEIARGGRVEGTIYSERAPELVVTGGAFMGALVVEIRKSRGDY
jgi:hypothetical protein